VYARLAKFEGGDPERAREEGMRRMESGEGPPGMQGYLVLRDPEANKTLFFTFYESREAAEEGDRYLDKMGDQMPEEIRGRRIGVSFLEVAAHKAPALV
jgi:hypothetical protein